MYIGTIEGKPCRDSNLVWGWLAGAVFLLSILATIFALPGSARTPQSMAGSAVKVLTDSGHGSGVHIGGGLFLTAAHVLKGATTVTLKTDKGVEFPADVLWASGSYDVGLLKAAGDVKVKSEALNCRALTVGEELEAVGNPADYEFVTVKGHVAALSKPLEPFKQAVITNMAVLPGMSGGPAFGGYDRSVAGIVVAVVTTQMGFMTAPSNLSFIVPSSAICPLLGRA